MERTTKAVRMSEVALAMYRGTGLGMALSSAAFLADAAIRNVTLYNAGPGIVALAILVDPRLAGRWFEIDLVIERARQAAQDEAAAGVWVTALLDVGEVPLRVCHRCRAPMADDFGDVPNRGACQDCADPDERTCALSRGHRGPCRPTNEGGSSR
jgi:hypothetical protein